MDESALRSHIAYNAGQSKTGSNSTGTGAVVELLKRSGHLKDEDGKLVIGSPLARSSSESTNSERVREASTSSPVRNVTQTIETNSPFSISIKIEVRCEPQDLDELGIKLRKVVDDFSNQEADNADEE